MKNVNAQKSIKFLTGYGKSLADASLFGVDASDWNGEDSSAIKGYHFKFSKNKIVLHEELSFVVSDSFQDATGNTFLQTLDRELRIKTPKKSTKEKIGPRDVELVPMSFFGSLDEDDFTIATAGEESLFVRQNEKWKKVPIPEKIDGVNGCLVVAPKKVLLATAEGFALWNGSSFKTYFGVEDEILSLVPASDDGGVLAIGDEGLYTWSPKSSWEKLKSPFESHCIGAVNAGRRAVIPSEEGVVQIDVATRRMKVIDDYPCVQIVALGTDQILALGMDAGFKIISL